MDHESEVKKEFPNCNGNSINFDNKQKFEEYKIQHTNDGGLYPDAYAVTEIIKESILNRNYKIYFGGGYGKSGDEIKLFDVVVTFSLGGDPFFQMCVDNSDGDACKLINSNSECEFLIKYL